MAKRVPKASKRRLVFLTPFIVFVAVYFLFTVGYYGFKLISLKNEQIKLSNDLVQLQGQEQDLKNEIQKLRDPEYLARYAREHFLYSKDGEYIIRLEKDILPVTEKIDLFIWLEKHFGIVITILTIIILTFIMLVFRRNKKSSLS